MKCMYCGDDHLNMDMYVVRATTKPRGTPDRWDRIGYCCEPCHDINGRPIEYDRSEPPRSEHEI